MKGHGSKFGRKKEEAIAALIGNRNVEEAARASGIASATLKRWMKLPEFQRAYREARHEIVQQSNARLQQNSGVAAAVLLKIVADPATPPAVRARTAHCILECANRSLQFEDIERRIASLEESGRQKGEDEPIDEGN
jgi:hypothetical protein